mmetsp:Transcript_9848/g.23753  ORF Transcript_9848/g.23753 Transcript_9848/m.23753 type:complete len:202 (-) Transcript_9848:289-894(-)
MCGARRRRRTSVGGATWPRSGALCALATPTTARASVSSARLACRRMTREWRRVCTSWAWWLRRSTSTGGARPRVTAGGATRTSWTPPSPSSPGVMAYGASASPMPWAPAPYQWCSRTRSYCPLSHLSTGPRRPSCCLRPSRRIGRRCSPRFPAAQRSSSRCASACARFEPSILKPWRGVSMPSSVPHPPWLSPAAASESDH